jgi:hypothetical protein
MTIRQVTTADQLVRQYREGKLTVQGLILTILNLTGKRRLREILEALPREVLEPLKDFIDHYRPGMRVFRGTRPNARAVEVVREWFSCAINRCADDAN